MRTTDGPGRPVTPSAEALAFALQALGVVGHPLHQLEELRRVQTLVVSLQVEQVDSARRDGATWAAIADALRVPEDVARSRFARHVTGGAPGLGEG